MKRETLCRSVLRCMMAVVMAMAGHAVASAQSFLSTHTSTLEKNGWSASVEFPTDGDKAVIESVMRWIADVLDIDEGRRTNVYGMLQASSDAFLASQQSFKRTIEVERSYEDEGCVTFEAMVTDKGSETWRWADCASFSKRDGHRIKLNEIFKCDKSDICRLMWQYRGDLPLDADGPEDLVPVNAGFIDGWIVVIGPALHYTGAPFRLRYEEILPYLRTSENGYFTY